MKNVKINKISDEERAAGIARFNAAKPANHVVRPISNGFKAVRPVDEFAYKPEKVIKANHWNMSRAYTPVVEMVKPIIRVSGSFSESDIAAAAKGIESMDSVHMTMSERIESGGRKASRFDIAIMTAYVIAVRASDAIAGGHSSFIPSGIGERPNTFRNGFTRIPTGWGRVEHAVNVFGAEYNGAVIKFVKPKAK